MKTIKEWYIFLTEVVKPKHIIIFFVAVIVLLLLIIWLWAFMIYRWEVTIKEYIKWVGETLWILALFPALLSIRNILSNIDSKLNEEK